MDSMTSSRLYLQQPRRPPHLWCAALAVLLGGCKNSVLDPAGPIGAAEKVILLDSMAIMLAIVIPTMLVTIGFAWWFRASNTKARYRPDWSYSGRLELLVWSIPALVVLFLGGIAWLSSHDLDPYQALPSKSKAIEVEVVSLDWKWLFIYPDQGVASVNRLVVPAGVPLHFRLTSASVMNSFFVPQLGSQIYTMAGMATQLNLEADQPGHYDGLSAQFSGDGFSDMHFAVDATTPEQFSQWISSTKASGDALDRASYDTLQKTSSHVAPVTYRQVQSGLFDQIVAMTVGQQPSAQAALPSGTTTAAGAAKSAGER
jgi:cytochrome o ubiquinol oxidase subunit 2